MNYLTLFNNIMRELNEPTITSSVSSQTASFHVFIADTINKAIRDIDLHQLEWPWNYTLAEYALIQGKETYKHPVKLTISGGSGTFRKHERITGGTSSAVGVVQVSETSFIVVEPISGTFSAETITGVLSGATRTVGTVVNSRHVEYDNIMLEPRNVLEGGEFAVTTDYSSYWTSRSSNPAGTTTSGTPAFSNEHNGSVVLNDGTIDTQLYDADGKTDLSEGETYRINVRFVSGDTSATTTTLRVFAGSSSDKDADLSTSFTTTNLGWGKTYTTTFTPSTQTPFVTLSNEASANVHVDFITVSLDQEAKKLKFLTWEEYNSRYSAYDSKRDPNRYDTPSIVTKNLNSELVISPVPKTGGYNLKFDFWDEPTELSADTSTPDLPARYHDVITSRVRYYAHTLRSDYQAAALCLQEYEEGIKRLRTETINTNNYIRAV